MEFRILGPLEVVDGGTSIAVPGVKERCLLAILLLHANELVSADRLIEELWREEPPAAARKSLQVRVANLRKALGSAGELLATQAPGYVLRLQPDQLDLHRFERLVASSDGAEPSVAAERLREALSLWRGQALADLEYEGFVQGPAARLSELRLAATEKRVDADLELGLNADLVQELESLVAEHPLREGLRRQLMLALYRAGRQADALAQYREARRVLNDQLGLEPGPALQRLERAILSQDPSLELDAATPAASLASAPTGTVTLLFTDVEASSRLVALLGEDYGGLLSAYRTLVRDACHIRNGYEVDVQGDAVFFAFARAEDAVDAAVDAQRALTAHAWPPGATIRARIGVHAGTPSVGPEGYYGLDVVRGARVCAAGHGGQVLVSDATRALVPDARFVFLDLGEHALKGLERPERLFQLSVDGVRRDFPPLRTSAPAVDVGTPELTTRRSILVSPMDADSVGPLLAVAEPIAERSGHELIVVCPLEDAERLTETVSALDLHREQLLSRGIAARAAAFTSSSAADDLVRTIAEQDVDLLLLQAPPSLLEDDALASILARAACDVAVLVGGERKAVAAAVLVPFGGGEHDWTAVELGARLAGKSGVLRLAGLAGEPFGGERDASRIIASASLAVQGALGVAAQPLLVAPGAEGLLAAADDAALVVVGLPERWQSRGLGEVRRALALAARPPVVLVRRGLRPGVLAPPESMTRFTWTLRAG